MAKGIPLRREIVIPNATDDYHPLSLSWSKDGKEWTIRQATRHSAVPYERPSVKIDDIHLTRNELMSFREAIDEALSQSGESNV